MWKHQYHYAIVYHSAAPACFEFYTLLSWQRKAEAFVFKEPDEPTFVQILT